MLIALGNDSQVSGPAMEINYSMYICNALFYVYLYISLNMLVFIFVRERVHYGQRFTYWQ